MGLEVELKAHVSDHVSLKQRIETLSGISSAVCEYKQDTYFCLAGEDALFRMRLEKSGPSFDAMQGLLFFTHKDKTLRKGIEVNEEVEFCCPSSQWPSALQFFLNLGYEVFITKTKRGYHYTYPIGQDLPPMTVELVEVFGLGWFLEMEFVLDDTAKVEQARDCLLNALDQVGIDHAMIEEEYYMHMLKKKPEA
ncbi:MAG: CYTH domain-containing protein [Spirochaetia bacterium]|nr:CYTH domain-containing protein [Spirochaetia bacterium]